MGVDDWLAGGLDFYQQQTERDHPRYDTQKGPTVSMDIIE